MTAGRILRMQKRLQVHIRSPSVWRIRPYLYPVVHKDVEDGQWLIWYFRNRGNKVDSRFYKGFVTFPQFPQNCSWSRRDHHSWTRTINRLSTTQKGWIISWKHTKWTTWLQIHSSAFFCLPEPQVSPHLFHPRRSGRKCYVVYWCSVRPS